DEVLILLWVIGLAGAVPRGRGFKEAKEWLTIFCKPLGAVCLAFFCYMTLSLSWSTIREYTPLQVVKCIGIVVIATVVAKRLVMIPHIRFQQLLPIVVAIGLAIHAGDWLTGYPLVELVAGTAIGQRINP